jgi:hypothetical protein
MDAPRTSLNAYVPWPETARLLDLPLADAALPARTTCPLCGARRLTVYADPGGGPWFHCPDCRRAGDLIELTAAFWGVGLPAAVALLARQGAPLPAAVLDAEPVADYVRDHPGYRQRLGALWQRAQEYLVLAWPPALGWLRQQLRLRSDLSPERWRVGPGRLLGAIPHEEAEACFCPLSTGQGGAPHAERYLLNPSRGRVFRGPGWRDVLAVPYYDLPGRICGFEFIGRSGGAGDRVFRPARTLARCGSNQYARQPPHRPEGGLAGPDTADADIPSCGRAVFAVGDATLALRLQLRHFRLSNRPLPLVAWHDGGRALTRTAWQALAGRPVVVWAWKLEPAALYQAIQADGALALAGPEVLSPDRIDHYLRSTEPANLLCRLWRQARPWREAVRAWADERPDGPVAELLLGLEGYRLDLRALVRECGGGRLEELLPPDLRPRTARVGARTVAERAEGWYAVHRDGREVPLVDAILRIDVAYSAGEALRYRGRVLFRGEEVPFDVAAAELEKHPGRWLRAHLLRQGKGVAHVAPGLTGLVEIALRFHEPTCEADLPTVGANPQ